MNEITIGNKIICEQNPTYIIAEIGLNHQGDLVLAKKLIDCAIEAGADCVKFQKRSIADIYRKEVLNFPERQERGIQYSLSHILKTELSDEQMKELYRYARDKNIHFLCTPWDEKSLHFLVKELDVPAFKIASADMFNLPLIRQTFFYKRPLIISTGMAYMSEIEKVIRFLNETKTQYILMHCRSSYPANFSDIHLRVLNVLKEKSPYPIGYSGHENGIMVSVAAVVLGARVIERHLTLDRDMSGPDHRASLEPTEFKDLVKQIRIIELSLGETTRFPTRGEFLNREYLSKSLVAKRDLKIGDRLTYEDIGIKGPGIGTSPLKLDQFIGRTLIKRDIVEDDYILESDIAYFEGASLENFTINHEWGIVVRMCDIDQLIHIKPKFVEIHLTDQDVINEYIGEKEYDINVTIHCPEYYEELLLDLSSFDENIRKRSINFYNRSLNYARKIKKLFKNGNKKIKFVVHPGGFGFSKPFLDKIPELNSNLLNSLQQLDSEGFEILIENMPSCPWVFGGQWWHSSFMDPDEIVQFSKKTGYGIVFDISHAALYCNHYKKSLEDFIQTILPVTRHIHISDACGSNGEGLKIGDGTIDFKMALSYLIPSDLTFLVEIWQGHKFGGENFVAAIKALKKISNEF